MNKQEGRDEKRRYRLSRLGFTSSNDSTDGTRRTSQRTHEAPSSASISPPAPPSSQATVLSQRTEKQHNRSMFGVRNPFLIGSESKSQTPNVARIPSRRNSSDLESGSGIWNDKQQPPAENNSLVRNLQRDQSRLSLPGAFRMQSDGIIDDDPTVYSQNTKETNPFLIDHASLVDNPHAHTAHMSSGGDVPMDRLYTNGATGGPTPNFGGGAYPMPNYRRPMASAASRASPAQTSPIGADVPVSFNRHPDGMRMNRREIRLMFLKLALAVIALVTGAAVAINNSSKQELPLNAMETSPSDQGLLDWNDDGTSLGNFGDTKNVISNDGNTYADPTPSPTLDLKDSRVDDDSAAPTARMTFNPTLDRSVSPTQAPTTPEPTPYPSTSKPTRPLETPEPSITPTEARSSFSPTTPSPSQSPTLVASLTPSVRATTATPTTQASQSPTRMETTLQPITPLPTTSPTQFTTEIERTIGLNATNTTGDGDPTTSQNITNTTGESHQDSSQSATGTTGNADVANTTGESDRI